VAILEVRDLAACSRSRRMSVDAQQVLARVGHARLGFAAALLVARDARGFLDKRAQSSERASMTREIMPCSMMA
jgi:hypothetical protein